MSNKAFVLMTALPPTKGHLRLIQFAYELADQVIVLLCTQPDEPFAHERYTSLYKAVGNFRGRITIRQMHKQIEQNPAADGFWDMWREIMRSNGISRDDIIVASEPYGQQVADICHVRFMPYDMQRELFYCKATDVRNNPMKMFDLMIPEFQNNIRQTVTVFGAESTGKTTLSKALAKNMNGHWLFEYARPYLETVGTDITVESMCDIWLGQRALQKHAEFLYDKPWVIQDTDLFSTVGYWNNWYAGNSFPGTTAISTPKNIVYDALRYKSDLYLITPSNIPFEQDPIRYGGDKRESDDQFWIDLCKQHNLNYHVLTTQSLEHRLIEAQAIMTEHWEDNVHLEYDRHGL